MTAKIIDFETKYIEKLQNELEAEADILFEGEGLMEGAQFIAELKDCKGVRIFLAFDDEDEEEPNDG